MTQEEKELLLRDLGARIFDGIKIKVEDMDFPLEVHYIVDECIFTREFRNLPYWIEDPVKPYLRPLSSMTEEEKDEIAFIRDKDFQSLRKWVRDESVKETGNIYPITCGEIDFCNKKHLDYRGLIPMGLALEALEGMYK